MGNSSFFILLIGVISPHLTADPPWRTARNTWNHLGTDFLPFLLCYLVVISTKKRSLFLVKNNPCSLLVLTLGISLANMLIQKMFFWCVVVLKSEHIWFAKNGLDVVLNHRFSQIPQSVDQIFMGGWIPWRLGLVVNNHLRLATFLPHI